MPPACLPACSARWIGNHGFSIGIDDVQPGANLEKLKKQKVEEGYRNRQGLLQSTCVPHLQLH